MTSVAEEEKQVDGASTGPPFPIGGPTTNSWREHALTRVGEQRFLTAWVQSRVDPQHPIVKQGVQSINDHLSAAQRAAEGDDQRWLARLKSSIGGAAIERTMSNLDAAESDLLRLAPEDYVRGQLPNLLAHVRGHLAADDPRRKVVETIAARKPDVELSDVELDEVVAAVRMASLESRREISRVRSFRNVLFVTAAVLAVAAVGLAVLGAVHPPAVPLCFNPGDEVVCPTRVATVRAPAQPGGDAQAGEPGAGAQDAQPGADEPGAGAQDAQPGGDEAAAANRQLAVDAVARRIAQKGDIALVELVGLVAAAVAGAAGLRGIKGTSTPYSLPIALAVLKLPTGALTAFLGILLMRGEFVPGLSALDSSGQIIAWAIVFGYAQQLVTRLVDRQAQTVLDDVGGGGDRPAAQPVTAAAGGRAPQR